MVPQHVESGVIEPDLPSGELLELYFRYPQGLGLRQPYSVQANLLFPGCSPILCNLACCLSKKTDGFVLLCFSVPQFTHAIRPRE
jgi:hypothetical protein